MKPDYLNFAAIVAIGVIVSGLLWLLVYSLRFHEGIGFDGPAGGILDMTLVGGWLLSSVIALIWFKRRKLGTITMPVVVPIAVGAVTVFGVGYAVSSYATNRYPDGGKHFVEQSH